MEEHEQGRVSGTESQKAQHRFMLMHDCSLHNPLLADKCTMFTYRQRSEKEQGMFFPNHLPIIFDFPWSLEESR